MQTRKQQPAVFPASPCCPAADGHTFPFLPPLLRFYPSNPHSRMQGRGACDRRDLLEHVVTFWPLKRREQMTPVQGGAPVAATHPKSVLSFEVMCSSTHDPFFFLCYPKMLCRLRMRTCRHANPLPLYLSLFSPHYSPTTTTTTYNQPSV